MRIALVLIVLLRTAARLGPVELNRGSRAFARRDGQEGAAAGAPDLLARVGGPGLDGLAALVTAEVDRGGTAGLLLAVAGNGQGAAASRATHPLAGMFIPRGQRVTTLAANTKR